MHPDKLNLPLVLLVTLKISHSHACSYEIVEFQILLGTQNWKHKKVFSSTKRCIPGIFFSDMRCVCKESCSHTNVLKQSSSLAN